MPTCYIVAGPPRSGTSLTAGILHRLGISMGSRLLPAAPMNPKGFFMDLDFDDLLSPLYSADNLPTPGSKLPADAESQVRALIQEREKAGADWGLNSLWIGVIAPLLVEECAAVKLVRVARPALASRASLAAHTAHSPEKIAEINAWGKATADYVAGIVPVVDVTFANLLDATTSEIGKLTTFTGKQLRQEALDFVDASLRTF